LLGSMAAVPLPAPFDAVDEAKAEALQQILYTQHHVEVPLMRFGDRLLLRVSCHAYNTPRQYERLPDVISRLRSAL